MLRLWPLLLCVPLASATPPMEPELSVHGSGAEFRLPPGPEVATWTLHYEWPCSMAELTGAPQRPQRLELAIVAHARATTFLARPEITETPMPPSECQPEAYHNRSVSISLGARLGAPALEPLPVWVFANLTQPDAAGEERRWGPAVAQAVIMPEYAPLMQVHPYDLYQRSAPGIPTAFRMDLRNRANGPTRVDVRVEAPAELEVEYEKRVRLAGPVPAPGSTVRYNLTATGAEEGRPYAFVVHFNYTLDAEGKHRHGTASVSLTLHLPGALEDVPGPGAWAVLGVVALVGWCRHRSGRSPES